MEPTRSKGIDQRAIRGKVNKVVAQQSQQEMMKIEKEKVFDRPRVKRIGKELSRMKRTPHSLIVKRSRVITTIIQMLSY